MRNEPYYITAKELADLGKDNISNELITQNHLVYSSPATLAFNSPGAQGFGVKRAGLAIPGSVMLLVAPGCCGRNTTMLSELGGYSDRFFYLLMDETDIITGRHLNHIPQAVVEVCQALDKKPSVVMICITCVDALLGTDMERVCKKATDAAGVPVLPCYMYALTREGRKPPMVHVRQSIYSLLEPMEKEASTVNILGHFAPLIDDCELYDILKSVGIKKINEISRLKSFDEYKDMAKANFNIVVNPEARLAADDIQKRLSIPSIELTRLYQIDKIRNQYRLFGQALGIKIDDEKYYVEAKTAIEDYIEKYKDKSVAIGECSNANPFELAFALISYGIKVTEIYGTINAEDFIYVKKIANESPDTRIYTNLSPTMIHYNCGNLNADITIGMDAGYYNANSNNLPWNQEIQPFGYAGVRKLFTSLKDMLDKEGDN